MPGMNAGSHGGMENGFRYFGHVQGAYDTGFLPVSVDQNGDLTRVGNLYGVEATFGAYGTHRSRRNAFGLAYMGGYRHYNSNRYFNGSDHTLGFDSESRLSRRWSWATNTRAGTLSRPFGSFYTYGNLGADPGVGVPLNEVFDNRFYFLQHNQQVSYQVNSRLSFTGGGMAMGVRRQSSALAGMNGYGSQGAMVYRVNRVATVALQYDWYHIDYTRAFGGADIHQLMLQYSRRLGPRWTANLGVGAFRAETEGLVSVSADPAVVALFGPITIIERFYRAKTYPAVRVNVNGNFRRHAFSFTAQRSPNPGNGVYLTSVRTSAGAGFTYTGLRKWSFGISGGFSVMDSVGQRNLGSFKSFTGGGGASYKIAKGLSATFRLDGRQMEISHAGGYSNTGVRASVGLAYSPDERPISIW